MFCILWLVLLNYYRSGCRDGGCNLTGVAALRRDTKNKNLIMKIFVASLLAASTFIAGASLWSSLVSGFSGNNLTASTNIVLSAEIPLETRQLEVANQFGSVRIHGTNSSPGQWTWNLTVRARSQDEASRIAQSITCQHSQMGARLALKVLFPQALSNVSVESEFQVSVPSQASVKATDAFGEITVSDLQGRSGRGWDKTAKSASGTSPVKFTRKLRLPS